MLSCKLSIAVSVLIVSTASYATGDSQIRWGACDSSVVSDTSVSCGFLDVPLDYHDPSVGNARLAVIKANATGERQGSVFFNPGGPGGSGVAQLGSTPGLKEFLLAATGGLYDVVSWDPRGVGLTVPGEIFCFENFEDYTTFFNGTIELTGISQTANFTDQADVDALLAQASVMQKKYEEAAQKCLDSPSGKSLKYVGTAAAVRDMVSIANVLDGPDAPINFLGASYGSLIGSWFVNMFPERVGKVILDGIVNAETFATQTPSFHATHQYVSSDTVYKGLITGCALAGPSGCSAAAEGDGPLDIDAKVQALLKAAHDAAIANASVPLSSGNIRVGLFNEMFTPMDWDRFMKVNYTEIVEIVKGEAPGNDSLTRRSEERFTRRNPLQRRGTPNGSPSYTPTAVFCGDVIDTPGVTMEDQFKDIIAATQNISHIFGSVWPSPFYQCPFWPVRSVERYQGPFNKKLANTILVASSVYDPVTPLASAQEVAGQLGESAALVMQNGFGHTTIGELSTCMNTLFAVYMINGTVPTNNTLCEIDADVELFSGVSTADILAHLPSTDV